MERLVERIGAAVRNAVEPTAPRQAASAEQVSIVSIDSGLTAKTETPKRESPAKAKIIAYLQANPSAVQLSVRKLAELVGVNHETARQVLREWRDA